ncbi:POC1 centriolar protein B [Histomonas meleagridis]|uniref:POC1 centriolar protein-like B n=1 Tax=Histomonas meleagridis TaxID=135588 RepID=UPI00355A4A90|nr:POC1 centriolar protein B [Histomonas meleagridis]KAH0796104.1 POC1 centriolar protein-like B [Histomonas meleagridis]
MEPSLIRNFFVKSGSVNCACITSDGKCIVAGSSLGYVFLFPIDKSIKPKKLSGHNGSVTYISPIGNNSDFVTGSDDNTIRIWKDENQSIIRPNLGNIISVSVAARKGFILVVGEERNPIIYDMNGSIISSIECELHQITCSAISDDATICAFGSANGKCLIYNISSQKFIFTLDVNDEITGITISSVQKLVAIGNSDGYIAIFDLNSNKFINSRIHDSSVTSLSFHPTEPIILSGSSDGILRITKHLKIIYTIFAHKNSITDLRFSKSGEMFVSCALDKGIFLWNSPNIYETVEEEEEIFDYDEIIEDFPKYDIKNNAEKENSDLKDEILNQQKKFMFDFMEKIKNLTDVIEELEKKMEKINNKISLLEKAENEKKNLVKRNY